jgi:hypothetical protein
LHEQRNTELLKDNNAGAIELGVRIANLKLAARAHEDKIGLLREAAEKEAAERRTREREGLIRQIESKLAVRDSAGKELADAVAKADRAFRRLIDIGAEIQNLWNWPASDVPAIWPAIAQSARR